MAEITKMSKRKQASRETMSYVAFNTRLALLDVRYRQQPTYKDTLEHEKFLHEEIKDLVDRMQEFVIRQHAHRYAPMPYYETPIGYMRVTPYIEIVWRIKVPQEPDDIQTYHGDNHAGETWTSRHMKLFELPGMSAWTPVGLTGTFKEMMIWCTMLNNALEKIESPTNPLI